MKILKFIIAIVALSMAFLVLIWRFAPTKMIEEFAKNIGPAKTLLCQYPVQVRGDAMMPIFHDGQRISLFKCIEERDNIPVGTAILYERLGGMRLAVIRERIVNTDGIRYRVSQEARQKEIDDILSDTIIAVYK